MSGSASESSKPAVSAEMARLKQLEAQLARMTKVFMDSADPIVIYDLQRRVLDLNSETERVFGWTRDELVGESTRHLLPPEFHELADSVAERLERGESVRNYEAAVRTKQGSVVPVLVTCFLLTDEAGEPVATAAIAKDITELKRTAGQLENRNRELQQFANVLAHDLGAPLHTTLGFAELLRERHGATLNDEAREYLQCITDGVRQMDRLIDDLLRYARIEQQAVSFQTVDCGKAFNQALSNLRSAIAENSAEITCDPLPTIDANPTQMVQLFQNLIGNAIKFRDHEPPKIHVSAQRRESAWEFAVRDDGIGIDAQHLDTIFDVFRRLHPDTVFPGTGIGLSICKAIVERHGGRIWVEAEKGIGSVFRFTIADQSVQEDRSLAFAMHPTMLRRQTS